MRSCRSVLLACVAVSSPGLAQGDKPHAPLAPVMDAQECVVWNAEAAFAASVEQGDRDAFAAALHPDAVFAGGGPALKGRDAVIEGWQGVFDPAQPKLRWRPHQVAIGARKDLALSRGPYWIENTAPDAPHRLMAGEFTSVWARTPDGWKVLFDGGSSPAPIDAATLERRLGALPASCD